MRWAKSERERLIDELGGRCVECGALEGLQFDHKTGLRRWIARNLSRWMRMVHYRREAAQGELQLLCGDCNRKKGGRDKLEQFAQRDREAMREGGNCESSF